jgi:hypothetical protein
MSGNVITVALIVGDPAAEDLQLNEGCLAAAAKVIKVHGAVIRGRSGGPAQQCVVLRYRGRPRRGSQGRSASHLGRQA